MPKAPSPREMRAQVKANLEAVRDTIARTNAVLDQVRKVLHELDDSRQLHRAIAERKAEQQPRPHSEEPPRPILQASNSTPKTMPSGEPAPLTKETESL
jgi:hypothetical protein